MINYFLKQTHLMIHSSQRPWHDIVLFNHLWNLLLLLNFSLTSKSQIRLPYYYYS